MIGILQILKINTDSFDYRPSPRGNLIILVMYSNLLTDCNESIHPIDMYLY